MNRTSGDVEGHLVGQDLPVEARVAAVSDRRKRRIVDLPPSPASLVERRRHRRGRRDRRRVVFDLFLLQERCAAVRHLADGVHERVEGPLKKRQTRLTDIFNNPSQTF